MKGWVVVVLLTALGWGLQPEVSSLAQPAASTDAHAIAAVLDVNANGTLDDGEIREAFRLWITGSPVPVVNLIIDDDLIRELVRMWIVGTPIQAPEEEGFKTLDDEFAEVAGRLPEFGGMFLSQDGVLRVYLTDTSPAMVSAAEAAIVAVFGAEIIPPGGIQALQAQYGFTDLKQWHDQHRGATLQLPGVVFADIDESSNRLKVGLSDLSQESQVLQVLGQQGVPAEAVEIVEAEPFVTFSSHSLQDRQRPLVGGIQISPNGGLCTLGFLAILNGQAGFVTNSHCTATRGVVDGSQYFQSNGNSAADFIGAEAADPAHFTGGECPSGRQCRYSDSAFVGLSPGNSTGGDLNASFGWIALPQNANGGMSFDGTIRITNEAASIIEGDTVHKVGRTTGHTSGPISETCVDINANRLVGGVQVDTGITMLCQYRVDANAGPGDSGSPVFSIEASPLTGGAGVVTLYGILWGGGSGKFAFSPLSAVQAELGALRTNLIESGQNSPPVLQIISPANGASVGFGALAIETYEVSVVDYEDGTQCCTVKWSSDVDGEMGGGEQLSYAFSTPGQRTITATATDKNGATATTSITVTTGADDKPKVDIDRPLNSESFAVGTPVVFEGSSFDLNEPFQTLPCESLTWTSNVPGDPFPMMGCDIQATFNTPGQRTITLTGVDSQGLTDDDDVTIFITIPGTNSPPSVQITSPNDNTLVNAHQQTQLKAVADDPDDEGPLSYRWWVTVFGNDRQIASGTTNDGQELVVNWTPSDDVVAACGTQNAVLHFEATDADGMKNQTSVDIQVLFGPC